jgi:putative ABC transport system permease protein
MWKLILSDLRLQKARVISVTLSVAAAVALFVGISALVDTVVVGLEETNHTLFGRASLMVDSVEAGVDERVLASVAKVPHVASVAPVIEETIRIDGEQPISARLVAVDLLADGAVRDYRFVGGTVSSDSLRMLVRENAVAITTNVAERFKVKVGDELSIWTRRGKQQVYVSGVLETAGFGSAYGGQFVVSDVYLAQGLLGKEGRFDHLDIVIDADADPELVAAAIRPVLPAGTRVGSPRADRQSTQEFMAAVRTLLRGLALFGAFVGAFLVYNSTTIWGRQRLRELSMLRVIGMTAPAVGRLGVLQAALLGAAGGLLGVPSGLLLADLLQSISGGTALQLQGVGVTQGHIAWGNAIAGLAAGPVIAALGATVPMVVLSRRTPLQWIRGRQAEEVITYPRFRLVAGLSLALGAPLAFASISALRSAREGSTSLLVALIVLGLLLALPVCLRAAGSSLQRLLGAASPALSSFAGQSLRRSPLQATVTLVCLSTAICAVVQAKIFLNSVAHTFETWLVDTYPGDITVMSGSEVHGGETLSIPAAAVEEMRKVPGVSGVNPLHGVNVAYEGQELLVVAQDLEVLGRRGGLQVLGGSFSRVLPELRGGSVLVSDAFARQFGAERGDRITLAGAAGPATFLVSGIYRDFATRAGAVAMDNSVFERLWPGSDARAVQVFTDSNTESVVELLRAALGAQLPLFFVYGDRARGYVRQRVQTFLALFHSVEILLLLISAFGILTTLTAFVLEQKAELAVLRMIGATRRQVWTCLLVDGCTFGVIGSVLGVAMGWVAAELYLDQVVRDLLSWQIDVVAPPLEFVLTIVLMVGIGLASGIYPARVADRIRPRDVFVSG